MFIFDDVNDPATRAIPHKYGVDDIPVIVQDHSFGSSDDQKVANLGDTVLVNGTYSPFLDVTTQAVRLRILTDRYYARHKRTRRPAPGADRRSNRSVDRTADAHLRNAAAHSADSVQARRRRVHQKQNPVRSTATLSKIPVSVHCRGQKLLAGW